MGGGSAGIGRARSYRLRRISTNRICTSEVEHVLTKRCSVLESTSLRKRRIAKVYYMFAEVRPWKGCRRNIRQSDVRVRTRMSEITKRLPDIAALQHGFHGRIRP